MKKLSIISLLCMSILLITSCEKDAIDEVPFAKFESTSPTIGEDVTDPSCYTLEAKYDKDWYDFGQAFIKLKVTIYFGGFGPGLYLGEYTVQDHQTIKLEIPEIYRDNYQFSAQDRFKFEVTRFGTSNRSYYRDLLLVNQLGNSKTYFPMVIDGDINTYQIQYAALKINSCQQ
ncbi:hypothetical protein [Aquimarina sp. MMG016]|uniref:hypothetical protein n=1 Tax=Aquimarina sp. MMG016 TaxID=2822690 RepID=UPI001B3A305F|nr:hypothetical protein [Aquimarina sp. MMG016]MBQ4819330.1 hypothetical protein [Aquimarina sp. MMG016]